MQIGSTKLFSKSSQSYLSFCHVQVDSAKARMFLRLPGLGGDVELKSSFLGNNRFWGTWWKWLSKHYSSTFLIPYYPLLQGRFLGYRGLFHTHYWKKSSPAYRSLCLLSSVRCVWAIWLVRAKLLASFQKALLYRLVIAVAIYLCGVLESACFSISLSWHLFSY